VDDAARYITHAQRWQAVVEREVSADEQFVYAVKTTGIYCRPSCAARLPKPEHVEFFAKGDAATAAGYRPCKRCKPEQISAAVQQAEVIARICRLLEQSETTLTLDVLAQHAHMSRFHFQRIFKKIIGVTPKQYQLTLRAQRMHAALAESSSVTEALYAVGYNSSGHFYRESSAILGMTPTKFRRGGEALDIKFGSACCDLGIVMIAATPQGVCAIELGDDENVLVEALRSRYPRANFGAMDAQTAHWLQEVVRWIEQPQSSLQLPLDIRGTAFQRQVWNVLRAIPFGSTVSYADIAMRIGKPNAVRAVATACASNQLALMIPCHRVIRGNGELAGYRWGIERKRELLRREQSLRAADDEHKN
jgi:AraC family transcriptional regulator, regulatory protein of adaptative response / methylated-DNA-[protein]-cysteine methyltransferase